MKSPLEINAFYQFFRLIRGSLVSLFSSVRILFFHAIRKKSISPIRQNHFLESLHFILFDWPKSFWKFPTAIAMGRSIATFLSYLFEKGKRFEKKGGKSGFTLVEMLISITLFSLLLVLAFDAFGNIGILRILISGRMNLNEELYSAVEVLSTTIKENGNIDYEEYFNRSRVGLTLSGGHYAVASGFGNYGDGGSVGSSSFGSGIYLCRSGVGTDMGTVGCFGSGAFNSFGTPQNGKVQRYGAYQAQFIDFNSDKSNDLGDADSDGKIAGDADDENIGM